MEESFSSQLFTRQSGTPPYLTAKRMSEWFEQVLGVLFPATSEIRFSNVEELEMYLNVLKQTLEEILSYSSEGRNEVLVKQTETFFNSLPRVLRLLDLDAKAMYAGDPAASSITEVVRSYPGFYAIAAHRMAHELLLLQVPLVPRALAEHAHRLTGIDINPGATIGEHFCIDHGTGVVIGETAVIGNHVKIYQGVTLGALSVDKKDATSKRHPTIEDGVVIYAGATILGGNTTIGEGSVIGGNVWITKSVPANTKVYYSAKMTNEDGEVDTLVLKP
jgi:serine O-acetyltransferase